MIEAFKPEGGLWLLRDTETGETLSGRGPFIAHKTALRAARQLNGEPKAPPALTGPNWDDPGEGGGEEPADEAESLNTRQEWGPEPSDDEGHGDVDTAVRQDRRENREADEQARIAEIERALDEPLAPDVVELDPDVLKAAEAIDSPSARRQAWLEDAAVWCLNRIKAAGGEPPEHVRVSISWPYGGRATQRIGECWHAEASRDGHREVFISPTLDDSSRVVDVLLHELCHASLPSDAKHGPKFKKLALAVGLTGKMTATVAGPDLETAIKAFIAARGEYPAKGLDASVGRPIKKQTTRLLKVECEHCGYIARVTRGWLTTAGAPICPTDNVPMVEAD
jgi:hypothetical protein